MTLLYYYGPIFRIVFGTYEEEKPKAKGKKRKKVFVVEREEQVVARFEDIRSIAEEMLQKERKKKRNQKLTMLILLEDL